MRWVHIFLLVVFPLRSWSGTLITFNIACLGIWGRNREGCFLLGSVGVIKHFGLWVDSCWPYKEFSMLPSGMSFNLWLYKHLWFLKEFEVSLESVLLEFHLFLVGGGERCEFHTKPFAMTIKWSYMQIYFFYILNWERFRWNLLYVNEFIWLIFISF